MTNVDVGKFEGVEVGKITGKFLVRDYQRGYRWTDLEVTRLLDDISESEGATYYLQPIVVKALGDDQWELIDGQQRLTTLSLIVRYFKKYVPMAEVKYTIEYETRPLSARFLLSPSEDEADQNIDFFHMYAAWKAIGAWLNTREDASTSAFEIYTAFSKRVKVIWYEAPADADSTELFTRLNIGRIPLTDAELVKALVLSQSRKASRGVDRAFSMASEWDAIERDLRNPELWAFLTADAGVEETHIQLLLGTLADQIRADEGEPVLRGRERPSFYTFETLRPRIVDDPEGFWNRVVDLHSLLLGWFEEREMFHKIGYLTACGVRFGEVLVQAAGKSKPQFLEALDTMIAKDWRGIRGLSSSGLRELAYGEDDDLIKRVLLLMNVETVRKLTNSTERYSFRAYAARKDRWSLEHIHAQNSVGLNTVEQWSEWLRQHRDALAGLPTVTSQERAEIEQRINDALPTISLEKFQELESELRSIFSAHDPAAADEEHAISNLALLERDDNSALNNAVFEVKRQRILALDRAGSYIPAATRNVFLKYYTPEPAQQLHFWSRQDRDAYLEVIERELAPYLAPEPTS